MEHVTFSITEDVQGEINATVSHNDGMLLAHASDDSGDLVEIEAFLPGANIPAVSDSLRAKTGGSGTFVNGFSHYQAVIDEHAIKSIEEESPGENDQLIVYLGNLVL